jgi:ATP-dependent DNA helicase 2 subunit 2
MSVIGCRTDETDLAGVMEEGEGYENIKVFSELKPYAPRCQGCYTC